MHFQLIVLQPVLAEGSYVMRHVTNIFPGQVWDFFLLGIFKALISASMQTVLFTKCFRSLSPESGKMFKIVGNIP